MNKVIKQIIEQQDFDRYLFLEYINDEIVGLNFHYGIGDPLDYYFANPCPHLTEIYKRLNNDDNYKNQNWDIRVNKAIELYNEAYIFQNDSIYLPKGQTDIIKEALRYYYEQYKKFNSVPTDTENYKMFDLLNLEALMDYTIKIEISKEDKNKFSFKHGVDFPNY